MPFVELKESPHAGSVSPVTIHYRDIGRGSPLVFLHGGWGYSPYPIDRQVEALRTHTRLIAPDRSGHGRSSLIPGDLPLDFHHRAAEETLLLLDTLGLERVTFWGHSDGSLIAAHAGLIAPERCHRLILEAFHFYRKKPASNGAFFQRFAERPEEVEGKLRQRLIEDHGAAYWTHVVRRNCRAWLDLAAQATDPHQDTFDGRLAELRVPVTFIHGRQDPRTEPGEIDNAREALPGSVMHWIENGRHSPHSEDASSAEFTAILRDAIRS